MATLVAISISNSSQCAGRADPYQKPELQEDPFFDDDDEEESSSDDDDDSDGADTVI